MQIPFRATLFALLIVATSSFAGAQATATAPAAGAEERKRIADDIATNYPKKDYAAVMKDFAKVMLAPLVLDQVQHNWEGVIAQIGDYQRLISTEERPVDGYPAIIKHLRFASANASIYIVFNQENKVTKLLMILH